MKRDRDTLTRPAREAIRRGEERYRALYESIPLMYFTLAGDGTVLSVNWHGAEQLGYTRDELVGAPVLNVFHPDDRDTVREQLRLIIQKPGKVAKWEFRKVKKDGDVIWVRESASTAKDEHGDLVVLVVCEDITEQKSVERHLAEHRRQLPKLAAKLVFTEERERRRLARDLHDLVGHSLAIARRRLSDLDLAESAPGSKDIQDVCLLLDEAIAATRSLTFDLSPPALQELGLVAALETLCDRMRELGGFQCRLDVVLDTSLLDDQDVVVAYRAIRELLMNVVKHAGATTVDIKVKGDSAAIHVAVEDNGIGYDPGKPYQSKSFGLFSLREQMEFAGGHFSISSVPGTGTRVEFVLPGRPTLPLDL